MARTAKRVFYGARDAFPIPVYIISDVILDTDRRQAISREDLIIMMRKVLS